MNARTGTPGVDEILRRRLTPAQYAAATAPGPDVLALACAGSGKSRTLAHRMAYLIANREDPSGIVAFTFTEKAAEAIKIRVAEALSATGHSPFLLGRIRIGTIHSFCNAALAHLDARYRQFEVLDENRLKLFIRSRYAQLGLAATPGRRGARPFDDATALASAWTTLNDEMIAIDDVVRADTSIGRLLQALHDSLDEDEYIDFSAMIRRVVEALAARTAQAVQLAAGVKHLLVDEYQDINPSQHSLIRELRAGARSLFAVGDDDQAIYAWRGADVTNIQRFQSAFPGASAHHLSTNFRSTRAIVDLADGVARRRLAHVRTPKQPVAARSEAPRQTTLAWFDDRFDEAAWIAQRVADLLGSAYREPDGRVRGLTPADFAILMRSTRQPESNRQPRHAPFTSALSARGIAYSLEAGGDVFERLQVRILRSAFDLIATNAPDAQMLTFANAELLAAFPEANPDAVVAVLQRWRRRVIDVPGGRLYPQNLVHELLDASGLPVATFDEGTMQDIGLFSRMIADVESTYVSVSTARQFQELCDFLHEVASTGYDTSTSEVLRRPDAVTVSTIHKIKGLEFPVVFVVDMERDRFPRDPSAYSGWLPTSVLASALARGAYQGTLDEEARLFYTALTRAERYLYVSGSTKLPGGKVRRRRSEYLADLADAELGDDIAAMPTGLEFAAQRRRVDETILPTSYSELRYYLRCPMDYKLRRGFGFSPPVGEMFGFGRSVHAAIGKLHEVFRDSGPDKAPAREIARSMIHLKHVARSADPVARPGPFEEAVDVAEGILETYATSYGTDFDRKRQLEVRFEIPINAAVIAGSIDLLLEEDRERRIVDAVVVDFKTMEGGPDPEGNESLQWTELALQVQLYAKAARDVLGENAATGAVHLLRDNKRVEVPIDQNAVGAAVANVEWAADRILNGDFPRRPAPKKCDACDFRLLCSREPGQFQTGAEPPELHLPGGKLEKARVFSEFVPLAGLPRDS